MNDTDLMTATVHSPERYAYQLASPLPPGEGHPRYRTQDYTDVRSWSVMLRLDLVEGDFTSGVASGAWPNNDALFLQTIYRYAEQGATQEGSVAIITYLDDLLHERKIDRCNALLNSVQIERLPPRMALAFVTTTNPIPVSELPDKPRLVARVRDLLTSKIGADRARIILGDA
jgi:hypothetical protein